MNFGDALKLLKDGNKVARSGWNGKGMWIAIRRPNDDPTMTRSYIYMKTVDGGYVPWVASQSDLLADDWNIAK